MRTGPGPLAVAAGLLAAAAAPAGERRLIGVWGAWGAFAEPGRCWAVSRPEGPAPRGARWAAFLAVGTHPHLRQRGVLFVRLSRVRDRSAGVTLLVGRRRLRMVANGTDAWAPDPAADRAAVAAIRAARSLGVAAVADGGRPFTDVYRLTGAPTAIDAAALACR